MKGWKEIQAELDWVLEITDRDKDEYSLCYY